MFVHGALMTLVWRVAPEDFEHAGQHFLGNAPPLQAKGHQRFANEAWENSVRYKEESKLIKNMVAD